MRTTLLTASLLFASPLAPASALLSATAQTPSQPARPKAAVRAVTKPSAGEAPGSPSRLPVTRVSLYKNGVGFFEHAGRVTGDQTVNIDFTTAQLNDVLQTLTAVDLNGGRITGANYNSTTPLDQQLGALPLSLGPGVTFSTLFTKLRGARVQVTGAGSSFTGRIVDIEMHKTGTGKDADGMAEGRFLTLAADSGEVRMVQVTPALTIRLLDTATSSNLTQFLKVLDANRSDGLRHLTLEDNGSGTRELHVSYLSEVPIWKSTYRILFTDPGVKSGAASTAPAQPSGIQTATLQGWSVVDNTTGADWINVRLSLIAGAPESFIQPLSVPYYSRRPEIGLPQEAQLTPQTHESGDPDELQSQLQKLAGPSAAPQGGQIFVDGFAGGQLPSAASAGVMGGLGSARGSGLGPGSGGNFGGGLRRVGPSANASAAVIQGDTLNALSDDSRQLYAQLAQASLAPNSAAAAFDDYFAYNLTDPITIRKNESALVPILQTSLPAESVSLVSYANGRVSQPLRALWIDNTSDLTLDRGTFTIVENGDFGGEGLLDPIHPGEKRLLSYAADQALRASTEGEKLTSHIVSVTAAKGVLRFRQTDVHEVTLVLRNAAPAPRTVISEFPVVAGWKLDSDPAPTETTPSVYRFRTLVDPGQTVRLHVGARREGQSIYQLTSFNDNQLTYILSQAGSGSDAIQQALQPILDARARVADMQTALDAANNRMNDLRSDEDRQRSNITALVGADKASRDRFVHDLNGTEDRIAAQQKTIATAETNLQTAKDDLANRIASLQLDQNL